MFLVHLFSTTRFLSTPYHPLKTRLFSTNITLRNYKLKSHSGTKKRWRSLANGVFKRGKANHQHLNVDKRPGRKNRLGLTAYAVGAQKTNLRRLLPYGSHG